MTRLLDKIARWFFLNYLKQHVDLYLKAELAKASMRAARKRYIGDEVS